MDHQYADFPKTKGHCAPTGSEGRSKSSLVSIRPDAAVRRTDVRPIDAFPWVPKPTAALAICQGRVPGEKNEVYLFYCDAEWSIERVQVWNTSRGPNRA
jgi:hypothetical protein